ncbi:hypothetical protein [Microbulbifer sp.]|uniref:hypothetical protein n=1 Tax=Microbulbifer sp. TaxID=1908541 RepID=UPI003F34943F
MSNFHSTSYSVDNGRVKVEVKEQVLDADGNLEETQVKENYYLVTGDLDKTIDAAGTADQVTTSYIHYGSGFPETVTVTGDNGDFVSSFDYDLAGYRTGLTDPNLGMVKTTYNALGQLDEQTDNKGQGIAYTYDKLGRLLTQTDADGTAQWTYDPANGVGALGSRSYTQGGVTIFSENYSYNGKAQLESVSTSLEASGLSRSYQHGYSYYGDGRLQSVTYPNGAGVTYDYGTDGRGYLHEIRDQDDNPSKPSTSSTPAARWSRRFTATVWSPPAPTIPLPAACPLSRPAEAAFRTTNTNGAATAPWKAD